MSKELIEPMEFFKIDKISDDVYAIGPNLVLRFNVALSKISNGKRNHFHKEYEYPTRGSCDLPTLVTIRRNFDYYLSIENIQKDSNGNKFFVRIGNQEFMMFKNSLEHVIAWFTDKKFSKLYARDKGKLIMMEPIPSEILNGLPMGKYLEFHPTIIDKGIANADKEPGIQIVLSDPSNYIEVNLDRFMGLYYVISCFNMYQSATALINYVERPEFGTSRYVMETQHSMTIEESTPKSGATGITSGRKVTPESRKNNISRLEG